jgi:threonine/homoserine/homoserine lactone efflux protein
MDKNLIIFLFSAVMISLSGVLSPGPMTAAVLQQGGRSALTGIFFAFGHGIVEMPLIFLIFLGAGTFLQMDGIRILIGIIGGLYLLFIGMGLLRTKGNQEAAEESRMPSSFYSGLLLSIYNPYFLLWWGTIGVGLVVRASKFGIAGLILFAIFHWLCDLIWYGFLSFASFKGTKMFGSGLYKKVSFLCGLAMFFYGGVFLVNSLTEVIRLK